MTTKLGPKNLWWKLRIMVTFMEVKGQQRSTEVKCSKLSSVATKLGQKNRWCWGIFKAPCWKMWASGGKFWNFKGIVPLGDKTTKTTTTTTTTKTLFYRPTDLTSRVGWLGLFCFWWQKWPLKHKNFENKFDIFWKKNGKDFDLFSKMVSQNLKILVKKQLILPRF